MADSLVAELLDACVQARAVLITAEAEGGDPVRRRVLVRKIGMLTKVIDKARGAQGSAQPKLSPDRVSLLH